METPDQANGHRSGFVAVMGRPNVGKSTLINALMGQKIAAVSPRPQTTRRRQLGILTQDLAQVVFVDTPGVHTARNKLGESMNLAAREALEDADVVLFLVNSSEEPQEEDHLLAGLLGELRNPVPVILAFNKTDLVSPEQLDARRQAYLSILPASEAVQSHLTTLEISALQSTRPQSPHRVDHGAFARGAAALPRRPDHRPVRARDRRRFDP